MGIDIRIPMGVMFGLLGLIITVYGLVSPAQIYEKHSLGININLWWGLVMVAFSASMLLLAFRARRALNASRTTG
jgi:hypothetical protein